MELYIPKKIDPDFRNKIQSLANDFFASKMGGVAITLFNMDVLSKNNIDYKDYVSPGKSRLKRFLMLFPEIFALDEIKTISGGTVVICRLAGSEQPDILQILEKILEENNGKILLSGIAPILQTEYQIDYKKYSNGKGLLAWLKSEFEEELIFEGEYCKSKKMTHDLIANILTQLIQANGGKYLLASIGPKLKADYEIDYKEISNGKSLQTWLKSEFSESFIIDGLNLILVDQSSKATITTKKEVEQMHNIAFMSWWVNNTKILNKYTNCKKSSEEWCSIVARAFSCSLLGLNPLYHYNIQDCDKFVFNTGIKTVDANDLYCVLKNNPANSAGDLQPYAFEGFCYVLEEDNKLSEEIKANIPDILKFNNILDEKYDDLRNDLEYLIQLQKKASLIMPDFYEKIESGVLIDKESFSIIKSYYDRWNHAKETIEYLGWNEIEGETPPSIELLEEKLKYTNRKMDILSKAKDEFVVFAEKIATYCQENRFVQMKDVIEKDIAFANTVSVEQIAQFKSVVNYYDQLMSITEISSLTDELADVMISLKTHFDSKISIKIISFLFDDLGVSSKKIPSEILTALSSIDDIMDLEETNDDKDEINENELIENIIHFSVTNEYAELLSLLTKTKKSRIEEAIITGDYNVCRNLIEQGEFSTVCDSSSEDLLKKVDVLETQETILTFYECGTRVYELIGNYHRIAEKYFLLGLMSDSDKCCQKLLDLYIDENDTENFYTIWEKYAKNKVMTVQKTKFLLSILCSKNEEMLSHYLDSNIYTYYDLQYANCLAEVLKEFNYVELENRCTKIINYITNISNINNFEQQLLEIDNNKDHKKIVDYINSFSPYMESIGYTDEEIKSAVDFLENTIDSEEEYTPITRLYGVQKNKNGTVEALLWDSLKLGFDDKKYAILLEILSDAHRYEELCSVFKCYKDSLNKIREARELYIISLINTCDSDFYYFVCNNMQDCISMIKNELLSIEDLNKAVTTFSQIGDERAGLLCQKIIELNEYLNDSVINEIIMLSDNLRETAINTEKLMNFGLQENQIETFASIYKTGSFSRDRDILSIAERIYSFVGNIKNISQSFAKHALECGYDAAPLLCKIYTDTNDIDSKLQLFTDYPETRKGNEQEYCSLLIEKKEYEKYLIEEEKLNERTSQVIAQTIIAKCHLNKNIDKELSELHSGITGIPAKLIIEIVSAMFDFGLSTIMQDFLNSHFEEVLSYYTIEEIEKIVTANGRATTEDLKRIQKYAIVENNQKLAFYIFEYFAIGRLKGASKEFLEENLQNTTNNANENKILLLHLRKIYAKNKDYSVKIVLHEITSILNSVDDKKNICALIENLIEGVVFSPVGISTLMNLIKTYSLPVTKKICLSIIEMCKLSNMKKECTSFLNSIFISKDESEFLEIGLLLCDQYIDAINENYFVSEWFEKAIGLCTTLIKSRYCYEALYCAYRLQKFVGNVWFAKFNLLMLLEKRHLIPEEILSQLTNDAISMNLTESTKIFDLFVEMADVSSLENIVAYCKYCGNFIEDNSSLIRYYSELPEDSFDFASGEASDIILKLLYSDCENGEYWYNASKMSLEDQPSVLVKLLYKASLLNNKESMWEKCIDMCERYSQDEILADALIDYASKTPMPFGLQHLRTNLAEKVNTNSLYFSQMNEDKLIRLISVLCERTEKIFQTQNNHNTIRDLSIIALSTNSERAYDIMLSSVDKYIFGENSNLGFAIACRLIVRKQFNKAKSILIRLATIASVKYKNLIQKLAEMDVEELSAWSIDEANSQLIELILPDGNYPDIHKINELTLMYINEGKAEIGTRIICEILDNKPDDYGSYMALYILCKQLPERIDLLHMALCGLVRNEPVGNSRSYYTRRRKDFAMLLSNINAIIISQQKNDEVSSFDNYDFSVSASEYYQSFEDNIEDISQLNEIQEAYDNIQNALMNQSSESTQIIYELVFGYTTGNWCGFFEKCWKAKVDIAYYLDYYSDFSNGMIRSILRLAYKLKEDEQEDYIKWLKSNMRVCEKQISAALYLFENDYLNQIPVDVFEENILELPFEENSVIEVILKHTLLQIISKSSSAVYPCAKLIAYLSCSNNMMSQLWKIATEHFEAKKNDIANKIFNVMNEVSRKENVYHGYIKNPYQPAEMYESMMRISGVFAGDEKFTTIVSNANFHAWSCINMVFALIYSKRANEVNLLKQAFDKKNQQLVDTVLVIVNNTISDADKLEVVQSISDETTKGLICYILKTPGNSWGKYAFLKENTTVTKISNMLEDIAYNNQRFFGGSPKFAPRHHFLWIEPTKINENVYEQLEGLIEDESSDFEAEIAAEMIYAEQKLSITANLEPITESEKKIDDLWSEHQEIHSFGFDNYQKRQEITQLIYQIALGSDIEKNLLNDYALRYGIDYYYTCMANKQYAIANNIIKEMVNLYDPRSTLDGARALKNVISNTGLHELLHRGYSSIRLMVEDYIKNKHVFIKMRNMLPASTMSTEVNDVNKIFSALEIIAKCLEETTSEYADAYRNALQRAGKKLGVADIQGWSSVRLSVLQMIREEINRVNKRPIMDVKIINTTATSTFGYIFGQVKNTGTDTAENISIQLDYSTKSTSALYVLPKLEKGAVAAFEVSYSVANGTEKMDYDIIVSYENQGEKYTYVDKNSLTIKNSDFEDYPTGLYLTDRPIFDFTLSEDGTINSENFFGREEEKKKLNSVFAENTFYNYKNVIIKGIRRAGKTSILNYLLKYTNLKCEDAIAVYVDCSGDKGGNCPIQHTFIDTVILECRALNIGNLSEEQWDEFAQRWSLPIETTRRNAGDLQYFYRELKEMNAGKGLMLILDEFDVLIEEVENDQGVDSTLLPSLRAILNSPYCQDAIHIVICGSTKLIRYMDGGTFNQLFQQFGDNIIEIGKLLEKDMSKMLTTPYVKYSNVEITPLALEWIWKYTSGLVWYSKLVANCALNRARSQKRSVVYPSDIVDAVTTVTSYDDYFRSLVTSCREDELKVLDAIQSSTAKASEYVTITKLMSLLSDSFSQKAIEGIVFTLERLQVLQRNPLDRYSYRFAVELYWHYFRVCPSNRMRCDEIPVIFKEEKKKQDTPFDEAYLKI